MSDYKPLRVTARLGSPVAGDLSLPLDSILLSHALYRMWGYPDVLRPRQHIDYDPDVVPLAVYEADKPWWFYACSFAQWPERFVNGKAYWNKRFDLQYANYTDAARVDIKSGTYKAYHHPIFYRSALEVWWWCVGDAEAIADLLTGVFGLGQKRYMGWGRVLSWSITETKADYSTIKDGILTRAIPSQFVAKQGIMPRNLHAISMRGIRPPYWDKHNQQMAGVAGSEVGNAFHL